MHRIGFAHPKLKSLLRGLIEFRLGPRYPFGSSDSMGWTHSKSIGRCRRDLAKAPQAGGGVQALRVSFGAVGTSVPLKMLRLPRAVARGEHPQNIGQKLC
jgi:hypothetical protein